MVHAFRGERHTINNCEQVTNPRLRMASPHMACNKFCVHTCCSTRRRFVSRPQVVTLNRFLAAVGIDRRLPNRCSEIEHNLFGGWRAAGEGDESISSYLAPYVEHRLVDLTFFFRTMYSRGTRAVGHPTGCRRRPSSAGSAGGTLQPRKDQMTESNDDDISGKTVSFLARTDAM